MKVKVYFEHRSQNDDGHYGEDNAEADYPNEVYFPPTWSTHIDVKEFEYKEIKKAFDEEDGDEDFSRMIMYVTDMNNKVIYNYRKLKNRKDLERIQKDLIEIGKYSEDGEKVVNLGCKEHTDKLILMLENGLSKDFVIQSCLGVMDNEGIKTMVDYLEKGNEKYLKKGGN